MANNTQISLLGFVLIDECFSILNEPDTSSMDWVVTGWN